MTVAEQPSGPPIEVVLFDMGGVLVELAPLDRLLGDGAMSAEEFWPRWLASPSVRALESGRCSIDEFAAGLVGELGLAMAPAEVIERFAAFPRGLFAGAVELVAAVPEVIETGLLSNTNALHWDTQVDAEIVRGLCDHALLSYELGAVKPDRELYDRVAARLDLRPDRILFLDDNAINVAGARDAGFRAEVAKGPGQAAAVLVGHGVIDEAAAASVAAPEPPGPVAPGSATTA